MTLITRPSNVTANIGIERGGCTSKGDVVALLSTGVDRERRNTWCNGDASQPNVREGIRFRATANACHSTLDRLYASQITYGNGCRVEIAGVLGITHTPERVTSACQTLRLGIADEGQPIVPA